MGGNMKSLQAAVIALSLCLAPGLISQDKSPRAYFDEMKRTGAFVHTRTDDKGEKSSISDPGYVCFAEKDPMADSTGLFFTFEATAYSKRYAEAIVTLDSNATPEATPDEKKEALATIDEIQNFEPYVLFLSDRLMSLESKEAADFFRKGGQELDLSLYLHGVKSWEQIFHRFGATDKWISVKGEMDFAVESSTMRFLWSAKADKPRMLNGRCEKINKDKP
jgi:hypothetical protein